jgi:hypothetical protein
MIGLSASEFQYPLSTFYPVLYWEELPPSTLLTYGQGRPTNSVFDTLCDP